MFFHTLLLGPRGNCQSSKCHFLPLKLRTSSMGPALVSSSVSSHSSDQEPSQDFTDNRFDLTSNLTKLVHSPTCKSSLTSVIVGARKKNPAFHSRGGL